MLIYPAIDIRDGKCVRLRQGRFDQQTVYSDSPVGVAERYARQGFRHLHVVDLDGAMSGRPVHVDLIGRIAALPMFKIQVGGGVRSLRALETLQATGADRIILGSVAASAPDTVEQWISMFGPARLAIAVDMADGKISTHGWKDTTTTTPTELIERYLAQGVSRFICTDISRDGMRSGPALDLYRGLRQEFPTAELIASAGISTIREVKMLDELGMHGAVIGTALLDRSIDVRELRDYLHASRR